MAASREGQSVSVDSVLEALGTMGRYQVLQAALVCMSCLTISFHLFSFVFTAIPIDHLCKSAENRTLSDYANNTVYEKCGVVEENTTDTKATRQTCHAWTYKDEKKDSIVSEWDLVCDDEFFARLPQSLFIVGQAIGALIFSALSDRLGRKPALVLAHFLTGCAGLGLAFSPNIAAFSVLRMINGICQQGVVVTCVALLLEMFPMGRRVEVASTYYFVWSVSTMSMALTAYLLRHLTWRIQQLAFVSVSLTVLLHLIFLKESIRWLITNKKDESAMLIIKKAAKMNGVDISTVPFKCRDATVPVKKTDESSDKYPDTSDAAQYKYFDLFRSKFLLKMSAVVWFSWLVDSLTYFSLYLTSSSLADDLHLNFFFNSLAEIPTGPLYWFVGRRFGRRKHFMLFHLLAGVCLLLATSVRALTGNSSLNVRRKDFRQEHPLHHPPPLPAHTHTHILTSTDLSNPCCLIDARPGYEIHQKG